MYSECNSNKYSFVRMNVFVYMYLYIGLNMIYQKSRNWTSLGGWKDLLGNNMYFDYCET